MLTSHLARWFSRPPEHVAPGGRFRVVVPVYRTQRSSAAGPAVEVAVSQTSDHVVIQIKGEARADCAGELLAALLTPAARRPALVTLDLSELRCISSLAMGVLVGYRRGVVRAGGRVRLAGPLQPAVHDALARAELLNLFETTASARPVPGR
jgi:anti-anti-sigma factor